MPKSDKFREAFSFFISSGVEEAIDSSTDDEEGDNGGRVYVELFNNGTYRTFWDENGGILTSNITLLIPQCTESDYYRDSDGISNTLYWRHVEDLEKSFLKACKDYDSLYEIS